MSKGAVSPQKLRKAQELCRVAMARERGQGVLFTGPTSHTFKNPISEKELPELRDYIAQKTKFSMDYSTHLSGTLRPREEGEGDLELFTQESVVSHTIKVYDSKNNSSLGIYFDSLNTDARLEKTYFKSVRFTLDSTGQTSPARDEEMRHKLILALVAYQNRDNLEKISYEEKSKIA